MVESWARLSRSPGLKPTCDFLGREAMLNSRILAALVGIGKMVSLSSSLLAFVALFVAHACAAHTPKSLQSRGSPAYLSRATQVPAAPTPIDEAYTKAAEEDRIDILPGWGKPDFGLFSGMCQDAPAIPCDLVEAYRAPRSNL